MKIMPLLMACIVASPIALVILIHMPTPEPGILPSDLLHLQCQALHLPGKLVHRGLKLLVVLPIPVATGIGLALIPMLKSSLRRFYLLLRSLPFKWHLGVNCFAPLKSYSSHDAVHGRHVARSLGKNAVPHGWISQAFEDTLKSKVRHL